MSVTDEMQRQAKALGEPSRFRLFRHIVESDEPVLVAELTELLGFHHNAIRQHLAVLVEAGLVAETVERRATPGRPRKRYTARLDALDAFGPLAGSYQRLAELLLDLATGGDEPYLVGRRAEADNESTSTAASAVKAAAATAARDEPAGEEADEPDPVPGLVDQLTVSGFQPSLVDEAIVLGHCPFADVAARSPGVICELHRGLLDGHLQRCGSGLQADLLPRDPHQAGCEVVLRPSAGPSPGAS